MPYAMQCRYAVQRCLEELAQCVVVLEQELRDPEEPSIPEGEAVRECDNELCETTGSRLAVRPAVQQKGKHEKHVARGGEGGVLKGPPM